MTFHLQRRRMLRVLALAADRRWALRDDRIHEVTNPYSAHM
jgi:hypothetical protein